MKRAAGLQSEAHVRKCFRCGRAYYYESLCWNCGVRMTWLDGFRLWRRLRRLFRR